MREGEFSRTALGAAGHRAAHQVLDGARIFADPLAGPVMGDELEAALVDGRDPERRRLRLFIALRSRIAEDIALRALEGAVRQVVVLGAGLDTFGYRVAPIEGLKVFEIDHPATQSEKRRRLAAAGVAIPSHLLYAPVDFERESLGEALESAGFEPGRGAVFLWLGVTPYLTPEATLATLGFVASLPGGAQIVFDYVNPLRSIQGEARAMHEQLEARVAAIGERLIGHFETLDLHAKLRELGFDEIEDFGPRAIRQRLAPGSPPAPSEEGGHILRARRAAI
jgi:methyltransferase (TIGR00027 family)